MPVPIMPALLAATAAAVLGGAPVPSVRPLYFEHVTTRDGLSQSTVNCMLQDSQGYLWLGTESGLDRYDGYSVREYRRQRGDAQALASDFIWSIAEDARGDLWLATAGGGVERWDRTTDRFQQFRHDPRRPQTLASDAVRALLIDAHGKIWAGTLDKGLDVLDPATGVVRHFRHRQGDAHSLPDDGVYALYADRSGRIWVGTEGGLGRYEPATDDFSNYGGPGERGGLSDPHIRALHEDGQGYLWVGTLSGGLDRLEPRTGRVTVYRHDPKDPNSLSHDRVWSVLEDAGERLWVATPDGLNLLDRASGRFVRYANDADNPQSLRASYIMALYQDRGGVLWVGTRGGGASHWNPRSWLLGHYRSTSFRDTAVSAFADDGAGHVWVGTIGGGLVGIDASGQERHYRAAARDATGLSDDRVMSLLYDRDGALWVGTMAGGLDRIDLATGRIRVWRNLPGDAASLPADGVMALYADSQGTLWVGTYGGGLASIDRGSGRVTRYPYGADDAGSLSGARASAIVEDALGNLWIGTEEAGLNLLDRKTGRFHHYRRDDREPTSLSDDMIYALQVDRHGELWIGTAGGGLDRVLGSSAAPDAVRFESQSTRAPTLSQVVYGIEPDRDDRLWLSTNKGVARFDPRLGGIRWFHEVHGLQGEDFNFNAHYQSRDGTLFFGGNNGFNAFAPAAVASEASQAPPPRVVLTGVSKLNHSLGAEELPGPDRPLRLAYDDKLVTLEFAALDFTSPAANHYSYQLEGFNGTWIDAGSEHRATYTNLEAGNYVFRARAANADGTWSRTELAIPVHVSPAPWRTPWARALYVLAALLLLFYFWWLHSQRRAREQRQRRELEHTVQLRTQELEDRNQQLQVLTRAKSDFVARMSHELRTPINGVAGMTSLLLDTHLDSTQRRFAEAINLSADSVLAIVDDVLDFSKIEAGRLQLDPVECDVGEIIEQTVEMLAARAAGRGIELLFDAPGAPLPRLELDAVRLRQVLVNLGGNALKFTERGEVIVRLVPLGTQADGLRLRIDVADTGVGIAPENQARIFEEFVQEDSSTTRRFGGTGLGLAICRQIVELMGGQLTLVSALGAGSTFSFEFTAKLAGPTAGAASPTPWPASAESARLAGSRVLVVDDNATARRLIVQTVTEWGMLASEAGSLREALETLRTGAFDIVLIDDPLPDGDAGSLLPALAERAGPDRAGRRPRLLRMLSFASTPRRREHDSRSFDVELTKPLRRVQLRRALLGEAAPASDLRASAPGGPIGAAARAPGLLAARVLVVEDQPLNREVAIGILTALGIRAETANDGRSALERLGRERFDAVLMDCEMPVMDGIAATAELRRREPPGTHLPVIALTADATPDGRAACLAAGMDDYLAKPYTRVALRTTLERWLAPWSSGVAAPTLTPLRSVPPILSSVPAPAPEPEPLLDPATLAGLRALPPAGTQDMLSHIGERYITDSGQLLESMRRALEAGQAVELARAAHAWRSYNGNLGALGLARLCRQLEDAARRGAFESARELLPQILALHARVCDELQGEMRRSA